MFIPFTTITERNSTNLNASQEEELNSIPQDANMGLSCGNSIQLANLKEVKFSCGCIIIVGAKICKYVLVRGRKCLTWAAGVG